MRNLKKKKKLSMELVENNRDQGRSKLNTSQEKRGKIHNVTGGL